MVKFGKKIARNQVAEWRNKYCHYSKLKRIIKKLAKSGHGDFVYQRKSICLAPLSESEFDSLKESEDFSVNNDIEYNENFIFEEFINYNEIQHESDDIKTAEKEFFKNLGTEFNKVLNFYLEKLEFFRVHINMLTDQLRELKKENYKKRREFRYCTREIYRGIKLLENYRSLNVMAFKKILKKHDKFSSWANSGKLFIPIFSQTELYNSRTTDILFVKVEHIYINYFEYGNRKRGKKRLLGKPVKNHGTINFFNGLFFGLTFGLFGLLIYLLLTTNSNASQMIFYNATYPMIRLLTLISIYLCLWGVDKIIYKKYQINYHFILRVPTKNQLTSQKTILAGVILAFSTYFITILTFILVEKYKDKFKFASLTVTILFIFSILILFCPLKIVYHNARFYFLHLLSRVLRTPFMDVFMADFFLMDQFTSFHRIFYDINYGLCFFFSGSFSKGVVGDKNTCINYGKYSNWIISLIPFLIRGMQCMRRFYDTRHFFPHFINGSKYFISAIYTFFGLLYTYNSNKWIIPYLIFAIISTILMYAWDVSMDWSLFKYKSRNMFLRDKIIFPKYVYWFAIVTNLLFRATWIFSVSPTVFGLHFFDNMYVISAIAVVELVRRIQWNVFRLENEHLNNVGEFRAVDIIPLGKGNDASGFVVSDENID